MGFSRCIIPETKSQGPGMSEFAGKIEIKACEWVDEAINELL